MGDFEFESKKKKRRAPPRATADLSDKGEETESIAKNAASPPTKRIEPDADPTNVDDDADYEYDFLLLRVYDQLGQSNAAQTHGRFVLKPPTLSRDGTKKSVWTNFKETCHQVGRPIDHVRMYLLTELGVEGNLDGSERLVIKGRFQPKQIESVLRRYVTEYVLCGTCKSPNTALDKQDRLYFVRCRSCRSSRTVASIKKGYKAQIGRRKRQ